MVRQTLCCNKGLTAFVSTFSFCTAISVLPLCAFAQNLDSLQKINQLKEIQINEYKLSKQNLSPTPLQILNSADLKRINSLSVADALRFFSGVQLKDYGGIGGLKTVNVRSMGSNHTAIFYNGVQLSNAQNGQVDLGKYSLDNLEEISLHSGQKADQLQPAKAYASASAIFLKTKTPIFEKGKTQSLSANIKLGNFGLINPSLLYQFKISEQLTASVSTEYINANGRYQFNYTNGVYDTTAVRNNGDVKRMRVEAALFGNLKNDGNWNVQLYGFDANRGLPGAIVANKFDYTQRIWDQEAFLQGSIQQRYGQFTFMANGKLGYNYTRYLDPDFVTLDGFLDNRFHESEIYASLAGTYQINNYWNVGVSSDYQHQDLNANIYRFAYPTRNTHLNVLTSGLKLQRFEVQANILSTTVSDQVAQYGAAGNKQIFSPTLMFSLQPLAQSKLRIRGFYKDIFRMPTFNDLYYTFIGNSLLRPEFTKQYDLGLTYANTYKQGAVNFVELQGDLYYNNIKDKIVAQPGANLYRWIMYNIGKVEIMGLELNAKTGIDLAKNLDLGLALNYTYQDAIDVTDRSEETYGDQIPYIPKNSGSFLAKLDYENWKLNYSFIYTGFRYNQKANIIYNYMQPWYTHDTAIGYEFKSKFNINIEVNNLLNQYYDVIPNFPMPGRNYRLTLNFKI